MKDMKILIIQTAFIGDVVLATPLIEELKLHFPDCRIDFLVRKGNEGLLNNNPHLNKVLIFDKKEGKYKKLRELIKLIRKESYDQVINVQRFLTTGILTAFSGAKVKVGFDKNPLSFLFTHKVKHYISEKEVNNHEVERNMLLLKHLIHDFQTKRPKLYPAEEDYRVVPQNEDYVCMAPSSVWFTKQMPEDKWVELIDLLPEKYSIYLLGGGSDKVLCESIQKRSSNTKVEILAGQLSFLQSAALMHRAKMNFVNDSAPLHFASAMNAPVTAAFCSTVPAFGFGPLSDASFILESTQELNCRPCGLHGKKECPEGHFKCGDMDVHSVLNTSKFL